MWKAIEQKILQINKAAGIEIIFMPDNSLHINAAIAEIRKNSIIKNDTFSGIEQIKDLEKKIDKNIPLSLVFNGKAVLIKKTVAASNGTLSSVLPNANPDDFFYEKFQGTKLNAYSIARKESINKIISEIKGMGFRVISISLGFSSMENILPFMMTLPEKRIETDATIIEIGNENEIADVRVKEIINNNKYQAAEYLVANQYIKPATLLSFSAAAGLLADDIKTEVSINKQALPGERKEYRYYKLFKTAARLLLAAIFLVLLANFVLYNHYFTRNRALQSSQSFAVQQQQKFTLLENNLKKKERFLESSGWIGNSRTSFFADRIASLTPEEILLTSMQIYPARTGNTSESMGIFFKRDTILVTGTCENPVELNKFMNNLKILPDFKNVVIKSYQYRNEKEIGLFSMEITTN